MFIVHRCITLLILRVYLLPKFAEPIEHRMSAYSVFAV